MSQIWREIRYAGFGSSAIAGIAVAGKVIAGTGIDIVDAPKGSVIWTSETLPSPSWNEVTGG